MGATLLEPRQTRKATKREAARKAKADRLREVAVEKELAAMGVEARRVACHAAMLTDDMHAKLEAARVAGNPYVGADGFYRLRETFTRTLADNGVDMDGLVLAFPWDPTTGELGVLVRPSPEAVEAARAAVLARVPKLALVK